jgi:hypothetical protein
MDLSVAVFFQHGGSGSYWIPIVVLLPNVENDEHALDRKVSLVLLMATALLCISLSIIDAAASLWVYVLNLGASPSTRWIGKKTHRVK